MDAFRYELEFSQTLCLLETIRYELNLRYANAHSRWIIPTFRCRNSQQSYLPPNRSPWWFSEQTTCYCEGRLEPHPEFDQGKAILQNPLGNDAGAENAPMRLKEIPMKKGHAMFVYGGAALAIALSSVAVLAQWSSEKGGGPVPDRNAAPSHHKLDDRRPSPPTNFRVE